VDGGKIGYTLPPPGAEGRSSEDGTEMRGKLGVFAELWAFLSVTKKWWLAPIVILLLMFGILIVATQGSAISGFIYTLF